MRVQDVMSNHVVSVDPKTAIAVARESLRNGEIDHLVVVDGKRVVGVIAGRDLLQARDEAAVSDVMTRNVVTIEPEATLRRAAGVMRGRGVGCLPVIDDGRLVGIVTTSDLLSALAKGATHPAPPDQRLILRNRGPRRVPQGG